MFAMAEGETIHTENSHKYGSRDARLLQRAGGWSPLAEWTDEQGLFTLYLANVAVAASGHRLLAIAQVPARADCADVRLHALRRRATANISAQKVPIPRRDRGLD